MTGNPNKGLPQNWNKIPGATGCTSETCTFRDNYEELIKLNAIPIGISTQTVEDIHEMTNRLLIPYDVLSDSDYSLMNVLSIPNFTNENKIYFKELLLLWKKILLKKYSTLFFL